MKSPGPDHPIAIARNPRRVIVKFGGIVVADTTNAITLTEAAYPPVQYIPREDTNMALLMRTESSTHCPYKGDAAYYSLYAGGRESHNAVWTYEQPFPQMAAIAGRLAFYRSRVDSIDESAGLDTVAAVAGREARE